MQHEEVEIPVLREGKKHQQTKTKSQPPKPGVATFFSEQGFIYFVLI